jgi:hypothetical protein
MGDSDKDDHDTYVHNDGRMEEEMNNVAESLLSKRVKGG